MTKGIEQYQDRLARLFPIAVDQDERILAKTVTFQVTEACNLACTYCYQINKMPARMDFDVAKRFIDLLLDADENSNEYINSKNSTGIVIEFIGGEPFLEIDLIDKITNYFIEQMILKRHKWATRYMISICSNGMLYFDPRVQAYIKKHLHHLSFSISIDSNKELHDSCRVQLDGISGSYDIAISGVRHFKETHKGYMGSKMTLAPENIMHTFEAVKSLIESYQEVLLNCVYEKGWTVEHARILYEQLKLLSDYLLDNDLANSHHISMFEERFFHPKEEDDLTNWCGGTGCMISVDHTGNIYPCIRYMPSSLGKDIPPLIIGNVYDGIAQKQEEKDCIHCMKCVDRRTQSTDECFHCPIAEGCSWCSAYNYQEMGSIDKRATYICVMHKARALANVYFWNQYYKKLESNDVFVNHVPDEWACEIIGEQETEYLKSLIGKNEYVYNQI